MAVTILEEPAKVALAYNPVRFKVQAESIYSPGGGPGEFARYLIGPDGETSANNLAAGDTITITLVGVSLEFTFSDTSTPTEGLLPTMTSVGVGETYAEVFKSFLEKNHILFKEYNVTVSTDWSVIVKSRNKGPQYNLINEAENFDGSVTFTFTQQFAGEVAEFANNHYLRGDLYVEDVYNSGDFNLYSSLEQKIIDTNVLYFDFGSRMRAYLGRYTEKDNISFDGINRLSNTNKRYYVVFTEYDSGGYDTVNEFRQSSTLRFIKAGIKQDEWRIFPDVVEDYLKGEEKVMSWRPTRREISPGQTDLLYLICWKEGATQVKGKVKFYYSSNTVQEITDITLGTIHDYETFLWNVGYGRITAKATIPSGFEIVGYECWWEDNNDNKLCESVFFTVTPKTYFDRYFFYESSWGTFETFKTESLQNYGVEVNKEEVLANVKPDDDYNKGEIKDIVQEFIEVFDGSTGNLNEKEALSLADFIISENKFIKRGNRLVNITVPTSSITPYEDDGYPYGFKFTYKRATTQTKYSDLIGVRSAGASGTDVGGGVGEVGGGLNPG